MENSQTTTKQLFKHTFEIMQLLRAEQISTEQAKAHANLIKQSNNLLRYELDRAVAKQKFENLEIREIEEL